LFYRFISFLVIAILIILSTRFYTLFERKVLGLSQTRIGVNKTRIKGILQPILDGLKLLRKELLVNSKSVEIFFIVSPIVAFILVIIIWQAIASNTCWVNFNFNVLFILLSFGGLVYTVFLAGWSRVSKYSLIGAIRSCSQTISYEISLILLLTIILLFISSHSFWRIKFNLCIFLLPFLLIWLLSLLAETNRAPFDFREGERELISGYNLEFSRAGFTLLFLAEYTRIILFSYFTSTLFLNSTFTGFIIILFLFLIIRRTFPRFRYDKLINLFWVKFLPCICVAFFIIVWV